MERAEFGSLRAALDSSPALFLICRGKSRHSLAFLWILQERHPELFALMLSYLDDFFGGLPTEAGAREAVITSLEIEAAAGVEWAGLGRTERRTGC